MDFLYSYLFERELIFCFLEGLVAGVVYVEGVSCEMTFVCSLRHVVGGDGGVDELEFLDANGLC